MAIHFEKDDQNIVTLTMDTEGLSTNVLNQAFSEMFQAASEKVFADGSVTGVILTSAKKDFIAGADLDMLYGLKTPEEAMQIPELLKGNLRKLETWGKPVVAALNGIALGGGMEVALGCHYRIAINNPKIKFGFPEVTLGLLPGGGGTQKVPRLIGIEKALPYLLEGKQVSPEKSLKRRIDSRIGNGS